MKILIVDSNEMRSIALKILISKVYENVLCYRQVSGKEKISDMEINKGWNFIKEQSKSLLDDSSSILFIHHNDNRQPYWREFAELFLSNNEKNLCVSYSGGDMASQINERHCPIDKSINDNADGLWHVKDFLNSIKNNEISPFDKLTGFDKLLEAKLELLHKCLVPSNAPSTITNFTKDFEILKNFEASYKLFLDSKTSIRKMGSEVEATDEDVFHPDYIEAVKQLRISLLGS